MAWPFDRNRNRNQPDSLTGSVMNVPIKDGRITPLRSRDAEWQKEAWATYKALGEVRFAARYHGNALSRVRYFVGTRDHPGDPLIPIPDDAKGPHKADDLKARDLLARIKSRDGTFASLLRAYGVHRFVAGESFLVAEDGLEGEVWEFLSTSEVRRMQSGGGAAVGGDLDASPTYERDKNGTGVYVKISDKSLVLRFWCKDPEHRARADSPLRPVLDICEALQTAQAMQTAGDWSRLLTMGLFLIPAEADLPKAPLTDNPGHPQQQPRLMLMDSLQAAMQATMDNPGTVAALSPVFAEVKGDLIEKFKRITFEREVDKTIVARIDHLIRRYAQGIDLPPEILLGIGDSNHWSAWAVSEEAIAAHIAPGAAEFCEDLTVGYLRTALEQLKVAEIDRYAVGYDVTDLVVSPDRATHALALYDKWELGGDHLLETLGFDPSVKPDMEEVLHRIYIARATNPHNPDPGPDIAALLGKAPPPTAAEKPVPGDPNAAVNPKVPEEPANPEGAGKSDVPTAQDTGAGDGKPAGKGERPTQQGQANPRGATRGQENKDGTKTKKGTPKRRVAASTQIGNLVTAIDFAVDQAVAQPNMQALIEPRNWVGLRQRVMQLGIIDMEVADRLVDGVITLAWASKLNPHMDIAGAAQVLVEAALFNEDDLLDEDDQEAPVPV